nr:fibroin heavy chain-like [Aegilops tauschii subsp. strangulata]
MRATVAEARRGEAIAAGRGNGQEQGAGAGAPEVAAGTAASLVQGVGGRSGAPRAAAGAHHRRMQGVLGAAPSGVKGRKRDACERSSSEGVEEGDGEATFQAVASVPVATATARSRSRPRGGGAEASWRPAGKRTRTRGLAGRRSRSGEGQHRRWGAGEGVDAGVEAMGASGDGVGAQAS